MSEKTLLCAMEERNRLIEESCKEIAENRAKEMEASAKSLIRSFELKRAEIILDIEKFEEDGKYGL